MYIIPKGTEVTPKIIQDAIWYNERFRLHYNLLEQYYLGIHPILQRTKQETLANNKVMINHALYITTINSGYLVGSPISYRVNNKRDKDATEDIDMTDIEEQYDMQEIAEVDSRLAVECSKYGKAYEYIFADEDGYINSMVVDPRNCIVIVDDTMKHTPLAAIIYSNVATPDNIPNNTATITTTSLFTTNNNAEKVFTKVTVVDDKSITEYNVTFAITGAEVTANFSDAEPIAHYFKDVPVIEYKNNAQLMGDYEQVISLIDAYNVIQSDRVNDKQQLVEALLILYGFTLTPTQVSDIKTNRILGVPEKDGKAEYITKTIQEDIIDFLAKRVEQDIHKISMTPNLSDENFIGNSSGVAIKFKLIAFNQNITNKERLFKKAVVQRFVMYNNFLQNKKQGITGLMPFWITANFTRNLPQNDVETATMIQALEGQVTQKTLVSQLSFVDDAEAEVEGTREEALQRAQTLAGQFGTPQPDEAADNGDGEGASDGNDPQEPIENGDN